MQCNPGLTAVRGDKAVLRPEFKIVTGGIFAGLAASAIDFYAHAYSFDQIADFNSPIHDFHNFYHAVILIILFGVFSYTIARYYSRILREKENVNEREHRLNSMLDCAFEGILIHDGENILTANKKILDITGFSIDELHRIDGEHFIAPEYLQKVLDNIKAGIEEPYEAEILCRDGSSIPVMLCGKNIQYEGRLARVTSVLDLRQERLFRKAQSEIHRSEEKYCNMLENFPVSVFELDMEGKLTYLNPTGHEFLGFTPGELPIGKAYGPDLLIPEQRDEGWSTIKRIISDKMPIASEWSVQVKSGELMPVIIHLIPIFEDDMVTGIRGFVKNISAVKDAQRKAEEALRKFEAIVEGVPNVAIQGFLRNGTVLHWNSTNKSMYGISPEDAIGRNIQQLLLDDTQKEEFNELLETVWTTATHTNPREWRITKSDGEVCWVYSSMFPIKENGEVREVFCVDVDITERKRMEEKLHLNAARLQEALAIKTEFLSMVSHELRAPLVPILGYTELILDGSYGEIPEEIVKPVEVLYDRAFALKELIEDLLLMSQLEYANLKSKPSIQSIRQIIKKVIEMHELLDQAKPVEIVIEGDDVEVWVDPYRLRQVIQILIENSIKYSGDEVKIIIRTGTENGCGFVSVSDIGIGISKDHLPFVFDRFYQAEKIDTRLYGGTGLGLAICREITQLMNGTISVESELGKGSTFTVTLPLTEEEAAKMMDSADKIIETHENEAKGEPGIDPMKAKILVIDDDQFTNQLLQISLQKNFHVITVLKASEGLDLAKSSHMDLILLDWMMPGMDGLSLLRALKENNETMNIPVIFISGKAESETIEKGLAEGARDFITKPFRIEDLIRRIAEVLTASLLDSENQEVKSG